MDHPCRSSQIEIQRPLESIVLWTWTKAVQANVDGGQKSPTNRPAVCAIWRWRLCVFLCENGKWLSPGLGRKVKSQSKEKRAREKAERCLYEFLWDLQLLWQLIVVRSWPSLNTLFSFLWRLAAKTDPHFWQYFPECLRPTGGYENVFSNVDLQKEKLDNSFLCNDRLDLRG